MAESYTPGHTPNATDFMSKRSLESHGQFFLPSLAPGLSVLDCGCGPGTLTLDIAARVAPAKVWGVDVGSSQVETARDNAARRAVSNVEFQEADCYSLPFAEATFDRVFSHALLEHLREPQKAVAEFHRVLRPGGEVGLCSPDWGGFILAPPSDNLSCAIEAYQALQSKNGGDVQVGRKLGVLLGETGFEVVHLSARYECYPSLGFVGEYLALQLERAGDRKSAESLRAWSCCKGGMFAQAWVAATARKRQ